MNHRHTLSGRLNRRPFVLGPACGRTDVAEAPAPVDPAQHAQRVGKGERATPSTPNGGDSGYQLLDILTRDRDRLTHELRDARAENLVLLRALREVEGNCYFLESGAGGACCHFCYESEGEPHDPECPMVTVLAAIQTAEARR